MTHYALLIDGQLHPGKQDDEVLDPATEQVVGYAARASQAQVDAAVNAAHNAFTGWAANPQARRTALALAASVLRENSQSLAELISREQGRPLRFTLGEVAGAAATFDYYAHFEAPGAEILRDDEQRRATERESQTNAAHERMSQTEQARREQEQQERLAREAQARQLAERQRQQQRAARQQPPLDRRTPTHALDRGR